MQPFSMIYYLIFGCFDVQSNMHHHSIIEKGEKGGEKTVLVMVAFFSENEIIVIGKQHHPIIVSSLDNSTFTNDMSIQSNTVEEVYSFGGLFECF